LSTTAAAVAIWAAAAYFTEGSTAWWVTVLVGLGKLVESFGDLLHGLLWRRERLDLIGKSQTIRGLATTAGAAAGLASGTGVIGAAAAMAIVSIGVLLLYDVPAAAGGQRDDEATADHRAGRFDFARLRELFLQVWPMGLTVLLGALILNLPRYAVEYYLGLEQLGVFAALAYLAMAANLAATTAAQVALPRQSRLFAAGDARGFVVLTAGLVAGGAAVAALLTAVCFAFGPALLSLVYGAAYADQAAVLAISMGAVGCGAIVCFLDHALYAARRFQVQLPVNIVTAIVTAAAAFWATRAFGLIGAAGAACFSMAAAAAVRVPIVIGVARAIAGTGGSTSPIASESQDVSEASGP
jgi:O-antigen/teichoic acid export membrane protein